LATDYLFEEFLFMELPGLSLGNRRNEDIALDLMKFIAMTTSYGRTSGAVGGVGFQGGAAASKPEEYADHLLELYDKCLKAVDGK
jgi:hypothetical protein